MKAARHGAHTESCRNDTPPCSELNSAPFFAALRRAVPPLTIHTDNSLVVLGWQHGKHWCCRSNRDGADLCGLFWKRISDMGREGVSIIKVKAHQPFELVRMGLLSRVDWCGDGMADAWAKAGCAQAIATSPVACYSSRWTRAVAWFRWVTRFATDWGQADTGAIGSRLLALPTSAPTVAAPHPTHEL